MTKIYYFSGTGNTLWSAKKTAEIIGGECELYSIGEEAQQENIVIEADAVVLLFPAFAYGPPLIVSDFVKKAEFKTPYIAVFVTFGTSPGGTLAHIQGILKRKHRGNVFWGRIPAVENYIAIFGPPNPDTAEKRLLMQNEATEAAARAVIERQTNSIYPFRPFSAFVSLLFSLGIKIFYRWYKVSDTCNGCGICEKVCPVSSIKMHDSRPVFPGRCQHCNACLNWCPQRAIQFGRLNAKMPRYHHPEISVADISHGQR